MRLYLKDTGGYGLDSGWSAHSKHTPLSQESPVSTIVIRKLTLLSFFRLIHCQQTIQSQYRMLECRNSHAHSKLARHTHSHCTSTCIYVPALFARLPTTSLIHSLFLHVLSSSLLSALGPKSNRCATAADCSQDVIGLRLTTSC